MKTDMLTIARLFLCMMDTYMLYRFFKSMFPVRIGKKSLVLFYVGITLLIFFENTLVNTKLNLMLIPLIYLGFVLSSFKISVVSGTIYTVIFYVIFAGGKEVAFELLLRLLNARSTTYIAPWFTSGGIHFLQLEYLFGYLFLLYIERFTKKLEVSQNSGYAWHMLIMPVSSLLILISLLYIEFPANHFIQMVMCGGAFLMYFSNAAIFIVLAKFTTIMNQIKCEELYQMKQTMEDEQYQNIAKLNERYRCYIHDIRSYLRNIRILALQEEHQSIVTMIDDLEGEITEEVGGYIYSGNKILNAILSEHRIKAKNEDIELSIFVEKFLSVDFISEADMISMFGNVLNNALEAAAKCKAGERRVDVKLFMGTQYMLVLYIENTFAMKAFREGERFLTTKKDAQFHGLGIGIVKKLAEKYGGTLCLEEKENTFVTTLTISLDGKNLKPHDSANSGS